MRETKEEKEVIHRREPTPWAANQNAYILLSLTPYPRVPYDVVDATAAAELLTVTRHAASRDPHAGT